MSVSDSIRRHPRSDPPPFAADALAVLAGLYDRAPGVVRHHLADRHLTSLPQLTVLAGTVPSNQLWARDGVVPVDGVPDMVAIGASASAFVQGIAHADAVLDIRKVETLRDYKHFVMDLLRPLRPVLRAHGAPPIRPSATVTLASANSVTPFTVTTAHRLLLVARGALTVFTYPLPSVAAAAPQAVEAQFLDQDSAAQVPYHPDLDVRAEVFDVPEGSGLYLPAGVPFWIDHGPQLSVHLDISWETVASLEHNDSVRMDAWLRAKGLPQKLARAGWRRRAKAAVYRRFFKREE